MDQELHCCIILERPVKGVVHGLQKGSGSNYETLNKQVSDGKDLVFSFIIQVKSLTDAAPDFRGAYVQGPKGSRFVYLDIGNCAGQAESKWSRRLKIPLTGISKELIDRTISDHGLETYVEGVARDGGPNCGTVKPFQGWKPAKGKRIS